MGKAIQQGPTEKVLIKDGRKHLQRGEPWGDADPAVLYSGTGDRVSTQWVQRNGQI